MCYMGTAHSSLPPTSSACLPISQVMCFPSPLPQHYCSLMDHSTVVPRITTLIRSSEIAVEQKRRNTKIKNPLKRIKTRPAKILHRAAILGGCLVRNLSQKTAGSHFIYLVALLKPPVSCPKIVILRRIGSQSREPIIAK